MKTYLVALFFCVLVCGCTAVKFSDEDRAATQTVAISHAVVMPSRILYNGPGQMVSSQFGLVGAIIATATAAPTEKKLEKALSDAGISVPEIFAANFEQQLTSSNFFKITRDPSEADAIFHFKVFEYGIVGGIDEPLHGVLAVEGALTNKAGKLIWRNGSPGIVERRTIPDIDFNELITARRLTETFERPSVSVSKELIKTLAERKKNPKSSGSAKTRADK